MRQHGLAAPFIMSLRMYNICPVKGAALYRAAAKHDASACGWAGSDTTLILRSAAHITTVPGQGMEMYATVDQAAAVRMLPPPIPCSALLASQHGESQSQG